MKEILFVLLLSIFSLSAFSYQMEAGRSLKSKTEVFHKESDLVKSGEGIFISMDRWIEEFVKKIGPSKILEINTTAHFAALIVTIIYQE